PAEPPPPAAAPVPAPDAAPDAPPPGPGALPGNLRAYLEQVERDIIGRALARTGFNRAEAAGLLGLSVRQLRYQMHKLEIQEPENRHA
ncbi:helix-turn-helix domain-containing protein, partial [Massilia sp. GCM10023247]|uniref:helix-turn-helix domain-containing protein n=1 Tax=Massilia sp. GCM10023247 TaxID=3252643 RepID=UPI003617996D